MILLLTFTVLVFLFFLLLAVLVFLLPIIRGAPFVPSHYKIVEEMVSLANIKRGMKVADLGSGDGRIVIALAEAGAEVHGYEINPILVWWARRNIRRKKLSSKAFIHWGSFWRYNLASFDVITVFGINHIMKSLEKKLKRELKKNARVVSNVFTFPNWPHSQKIGRVYIYERSSL